MELNEREELERCSVWMFFFPEKKKVTLKLNKIKEPGHTNWANFNELRICVDIFGCGISS